MSRIRNLITSMLGEGALLLVVGTIGWAAHWPFVFASLGPTAYEQLEKPHSKSAHPYSVLMGHMVAVCAGFFALWILNAWASPKALSVGYIPAQRLWASVIAAGLTAGVTLAINASQPASLSTSLLITLGSMQTGRDAVAIAIGVLILTAVGEPVRRRRARQLRAAPRAFTAS